MKNAKSISDKGLAFLSDGNMVANCCKVECSNYLQAWFQALKHSPHYIQMCRSGLFTCEASFKTYELFGVVEDLSFEHWWTCKGIDQFGCGCIEISKGHVITYESDEAGLKVTLSIQMGLRAKAIQFEDMAIAASNKFRGLLSERPVMWPFFRAKISPFAIEKSLQVVKACQSFAKTGKFKMWEIGEQLNLKSTSTSQPGDWQIDLVDKHIDMGKLVSAENRRGMNLARNAALGIFPRFTD